MVKFLVQLALISVVALINPSHHVYGQNRIIAELQIVHGAQKKLVDIRMQPPAIVEIKAENIPDCGPGGVVPHSTVVGGVCAILASERVGETKKLRLKVPTVEGRPERFYLFSLGENERGTWVYSGQEATVASIPSGARTLLLKYWGSSS